MVMPNLASKSTIVLCAGANTTQMEQIVENAAIFITTDPGRWRQRLMPMNVCVSQNILIESFFAL